MPWLHVKIREHILWLLVSKDKGQSHGIYGIGLEDEPERRNIAGIPTGT